MVSGQPLRYAVATGLCLAQIGEFSFVLATIAQTQVDGVALTRIEEAFTNNSGRTGEATYRFWLPSRASITRLALDVKHSALGPHAVAADEGDAGMASGEAPGIGTRFDKVGRRQGFGERGRQTEGLCQR